MGYFLKRNIIAIIAATFIFIFSLFVNIGEQSFYENNRMVANSIRVEATLDDAGNISIVETMDVSFESGMSVFFRDIVYRKDNAGFESNISSFDESSVRVRIFDASNRLILDSNESKNNSLAKVGYSFEGDRDELGELIACPSNYGIECESIFTQVIGGAYPKTTFEYSYTINGAVSVFSDISELNWIFVDDYGIEVNNVEVILNYPPTLSEDIVRFYGHGTSTGEGEILSPSQMKFSVSKLLPGEVLEARVILPVSIFSDANSRNVINQAYLQIMEAKESRISFMDNLLVYLNYLGYILIIGLFILAFFIFRYIYLKYDKEHTPVFKGEYYRELPAPYSPAEMSYLYNFKDISKYDLTATLMDLIRRKYIILETLGESLSNKKVNYKFKLNKDLNISELKKHESFLLEWFFSTIGKNQEVLSVDQIEAYAKNSLTAEKYLIDNQKWIHFAKNEASKNDFFDKIVESATLKYLLVPGLMLIVGLILFFLNINQVELVMFQSVNPLTGALIGLSIVMISYLISIKRRSVQGNEEFVKWKGLKKFLQDFSSFKDYPVPSIIVWEHYLVYATSFGVAELVMKQLRIKFKELNLDENEYYRRSPVMRYPFFWIHMNNRMVNTTNLARSSVAAARAQKSGSGGRGGGFGGGRSFGGGGGGIRGR